MAVETFVSIVAEPFIKYVVTPAVRHISYAFRCNSNVETLQNQVEKLKNKRLERQQLVEAATRNGEQVFSAVTEWLTTAEKEIEDAEQLMQGKGQAMVKCCMGICPNFKTRYQLSKKAHKKALAVVEQLEEVRAAGSDPISSRPALQPIIEPSLYSSEALPSRVLILDQIMDALRDPKLNVIGVYGMGGIGKTTLAKEVKGKATQEKMLFDTVVMVSVSQTPDVRRIQGEIADSLGLKFNEEEIPGRASRLHQRLEKAKVLIILDDIWQELDLNDVGVPSTDGCKIFLTSRRKDVLCNEMRTQKEFSLDPLEEEETWRLFAMSVSNVTNPELHLIAAEIARKCAGLPLLILKVAADLRDKPSYVWSDMLNRLSNPENTDIYKKVHRVIESSYDQLLDEEAKSLFLLCALFGDSNVEIHKLVMYSVGLRLFKRIGTIEGARNRVLSLIDKLKNECLLLDDNGAGFVKIHDVVSEIAVVIASRVQNAFVGAGKVRYIDFQNRDCTRISFPYCDIEELPGVVDCPKAEVFSLFAMDDLPAIPSSFLEGCLKLKVLDFSGALFVSGLPSSLGFLEGLQTLCLQRCWLSNVATVAELKQLEVLSFAGSQIKELPGEIKELTRLKLLDLRDCRHLKVIPENVLSNLSSLEELYVLNSFTGWEAGGNAKLVELKNLSLLTSLEIQVRDDKFLQEDWFFDGVQNYRISIGNWHSFYEDLRDETERRVLQLQLARSSLTYKIKEFVRGTEVLQLQDLNGIENLFDDYVPNPILWKLRILIILGCDTMSSTLFSHSFIEKLPQLQEVQVMFCNNVEAIVGEGCGDEMIELTQLTSLELRHVPDLIGFCKTIGMVSFPNLTNLGVSNCDRLKYVFTTSMVKSLKQLNYLDISDCRSVEEVILSEEAEEIIEEAFPKLEFLRVQNLEELKRFSRGYPIDFPLLIELKILDCRKIENFVSKFLDENDDKYIFFNELVRFSNLETLSIHEVDTLKYVWSEDINVEAFDSKYLQSIEVKSCPDLKYVFPKSIACSLPHLQSITIDKCGVEVIVRNVEGAKFEWPSLASLKVDQCNYLKYVFPASTAKSLKQLKELDIRECELMEEIILSEEIEEENDNTVVFPQLEILQLADLKNLKRFSSGYPIDFPFLRELKIYGCPKMENLVSKISDGSSNDENVDECLFNEMVTFSNVKELYIHNMNKLRYIWSKDITSSQNLESIRVSHCQKLKYVFPASVACGLLQLRELVIKECSVEVVIGKAEDDIFEWPNLTHLEIRDCHSLICISSNNSKVTFSNLKTLSIEWLKYIWSENIELKNLHSVYVSTCLDMKYVFPASVASTLVQLRELEMKECGVEAIIGNAEHETFELPNLTKFKLSCCHNLISVSANNCKVIFSNLVELHIDRTDKLKYIWSEGANIEAMNLQILHISYCPDLEYIFPVRAKDETIEIKWPNLRRVEIYRCNGLKYVLTSSMAKSLKHLLRLRVSECEMMEEIILSVETGEYNINGIVFPQLSYVTLAHLPKLQAISKRHPTEFPSLRVFGVTACSKISKLKSKFHNRSNHNENDDDNIFNKLVTFGMKKRS